MTNLVPSQVASSFVEIKRLSNVSVATSGGVPHGPCADANSTWGIHGVLAQIVRPESACLERSTGESGIARYEHAYFGPPVVRFSQPNRAAPLSVEVGAISAPTFRRGANSLRDWSGVERNTREFSSSANAAPFKSGGAVALGSAERAFDAVPRALPTATGAIYAPTEERITQGRTARKPVPVLSLFPN